MNPRHAIEITFINPSAGPHRAPFVLHFGEGYSEATIQRISQEILWADEVKAVRVQYAREVAVARS
jgi:hypothetical protein